MREKHIVTVSGNFEKARLTAPFVCYLARNLCDFVWFIRS